MSSDIKFIYIRYKISREIINNIFDEIKINMIQLRPKYCNHIVLMTLIYLTILFQKKSREKAMIRHDTVLRLLIRRYVTAEQRKRDEFNITEDDVREIRQDISTFRYELIDILRKNGMHAPQLDKEETTSQYIYMYT